MKKKPPVSAKKLAAGLSAVFVSLTLLAGVLAYTFLENPYENDNTQDKPSSSEQAGSNEENDREQSSSDADANVNKPSVIERLVAWLSLDPKADASSPVASDEQSSDGADAESDASGDEQDGESSEASSSEPDPEPEPEPEPEPVFFNIPDEMRAVQLVAGRDYAVPGTDLVSGATTTAAQAAAQIDEALKSAKSLTMNTLLVDTRYNDAVLYDAGGVRRAGGEFDCMDYICTRAREEGMYIYAVYGAGVLPGLLPEGQTRTVLSDGDTLDAVYTTALEFAQKYKLDGILLDQYDNPASGAAYAAYLAGGAGEGYENHLREQPRAMLTVAAGAVRESAPGTQVGLLADGVWDNKSVNELGSETAAPYTQLGSGNADTRTMVLDGMFDLVMLKNFGSTTSKEAGFETVAAWWKQVAEEAGKLFYVMQASSKAGTQEAGWGASEQLTTQVISLEKLGGVSGFAYDSLKALAQNAGNAATMLVKYLNDQINEAYVLTQLALSKPAKLTFTTKEQTVTFQGASDPQEKVTINGEAIPTNESGYFTIKEDLKAGVNTFKIEHKDKVYTYTITREVEVLREVHPSGSIAVEGGTTVTVTALAYVDAQVTATIGGQTVSLVATENLEDEELRSSGYVLYMGEFTAPAASASATQLGNINVTATAQGTSKTLPGASVTVNKIAVMDAGAVVQVVADQAETFPVTSLDDKSNPSYFPLPKGTIDMTNGDEIAYNNGKKTLRYWKLQSGVRVYSDDIKAVGAALPDNNEISSMSVKSSGQYTTVTLATREQVPFIVKYDGAKVTFAFQYTATVPQSADIANNALFSGASWSGSELTLTLRKQGAFLGYRAEYDGSDLMLRFNNSPGSLKGARVVVDPGHSTDSPGAAGFYPGKDEANINASIAEKLVAELKSRGATVLKTTPNGSDLETRIAQARAFNSQVFVSVHGNSSATNAAATGTEVYYFYPYSKQLAANISANVASALNTENRGAKWGLMYVTRESQFPAVLVETGFVSNEKEYTKLINSKYQNRIAEAIANGVNSFLGGANSGGFTDDASNEEEESSNDEEDSSNEKETSSGKIKLSKTSLSLLAGETATLTAKQGSKTADVNWESDATDVAKVSQNGKVTAVSAGTATIYAVSADGDGEASCTVTVEEEGVAAGSGDGVRVKSVTIEGGKTLYIGDQQDYSAYVSPEDAQDIGVSWRSSNEDVMAILSYDDTTCTVEGISAGSVKLIATAYDNEKIVKEFTIRIEE